MVEIVFDDGGTLRPLVFDVIVEERHAMASRATEHEVERGVSIADHVRAERRILTLGQVVVSDHPLESPELDASRARDAWELLLEARDRALLATVTTKRETYEDMVLTEATSRHTAADGTCISADLTFTQIRQVSTELVADPRPARVRDRQQVDQGSQSTTPTTPTPRVRSLMTRSLEAIGGVFE